MTFDSGQKKCGLPGSHRDATPKNRYIGRIRFFDPDKKFGFIDTNWYGDEVISVDSVTRELFFSVWDIKEADALSPDDWVTFTISKSSGGRRDNARQVQKVKCCYYDLNLAMQYVYPYSVVNVKNRSGFFDGYDIQKSVIDFFLGSTEGCQLLLDYAVDKLSKRDGSKWRHAITGLFCSDEVVNILSDPESRGLKVKSIAGLEQVLLSICYYMILEMPHETARSLSNDHLFDQTLSAIQPCIVKLSSKSVHELANMICMLFADDTERACSCLVYINKYLCGLSRISWNKINVDVGQRFRLFNKGIEASVLFDETVIEYWNGRAALALSYIQIQRDASSARSFIQIDASFSCFSSRSSNREEILQYVLSSGNASDKLLFYLSYITGSSNCLTGIKSQNFFVEELPRFGNVFVGWFLSWCRKFIPWEVVIKAIKAIGIERIYYSYSLPELFRCLPDDMFVDMFAVIHKHHSEERIEKGSLYGGHFTWFEGTNGEHLYDKDTYLDIMYSCRIVMKNDKVELIDPTSPSLLNDSVLKTVDSCLRSNQITSSLLVRSSQQTECPTLVRLNIVDIESMSCVGKECKEILRFDNHLVSIHIKHETIDIDL